MSAGEIVPLAALGVTVAGWFVTSALTAAAATRKSRVDAVVGYTERQLEQLYGPLMALLVEGDQAWRECLRELGYDPDDPRRAERELSDALAASGDDRGLSDEQLATWRFWIEYAFFPRNDKIEDLIATKAHLIEGPESGSKKDDGSLPSSYCQFLAHHNTWKLLHTRWEKEDVPYSWCWTVPWPEPFNSEVEQTFHGLKQRHNVYLRLQRKQRLRSAFTSLPDKPVQAVKDSPETESHRGDRLAPAPPAAG